MPDNVSSFLPKHEPFLGGDAKEMRSKFCVLFNLAFECELSEEDIDKLLDALDFYYSEPGELYKKHGLPDRIAISYDGFGDGYRSTYMLSYGRRRLLVTIASDYDEHRMELVGCTYSPEVKALLQQEKLIGS